MLKNKRLPKSNILNANWAFSLISPNDVTENAITNSEKSIDPLLSRSKALVKYKKNINEYSIHRIYFKEFSEFTKIYNFQSIW